MNRINIPVIDIAALGKDDPIARAAVVRKIGAACRGIGFFAITRHGVDQPAIDQAFAAAHAVFALPAPSKRELAIAGTATTAAT